MRKDATVNYEVDKTIRHTRAPTGTIKRLSVAVVVNHRQVTGNDGKTLAKPLTEAELKQINDLTREAMGFNKERGDTLNVANTPFEAAAREAMPETPLWKDPALVSLAKEAGKYLLFGALAAWLFFGVARPFARDMAARAAAEREQRQLAAEQEAALAGHLPATLRAPLPFDQKLLEAKALAKQDPKLVASVIKEWVGGNER
jgi:flagellar M-ring protein FliF